MMPGGTPPPPQQPQQVLPPNSLFDVILDIPHPGQSSSSAGDYKIYLPPLGQSQSQSSSNNSNALLYGTNIVNCPSLSTLLAEFGGSVGGGGAAAANSSAAGVAKIQRYAFPEYNDNTHAVYLRQYTAMKLGTGYNASNLNKYDTYLENAYAPPSSNTAANGGVVLLSNSCACMRDRDRTQVRGYIYPTLLTRPEWVARVVLPTTPRGLSTTPAQKNEGAQEGWGLRLFPPPPRKDLSSTAE
jgi:hypothetical protein